MFFKRKAGHINLMQRHVLIEVLRKCEALQRRFADYLQAKSETLSLHTKRYTLVFFCVLFGGTSISIIIHAVTTTVKPMQAIKIVNPVLLNKDNELFLLADSIISKQDYDRIEHFKNKLFDLRKNAISKTSYDSIMKARPQLLDSIALLERIYLSQLKNK